MKILQYTINANKEEILKTGVYTITHLSKPNIYYVGSASSTIPYGGFYYRWNKHINDLKNNVHHTSKLQNTINKYGVEGVRFEIIDFYDSIYCVGAEQYWINMLNPFYNSAKKAGSNLGYKFPEEYETKSCIPILQYDLDGNFIKRFKSAPYIETKLGFNSAAIRDCCRGKNYKSYGFQWKYEKDSRVITKYISKVSKPILMYNSSGNFVRVFDSILQASKILNIPSGNISKQLSGEYKICYGYIFKHFDKDYTDKLKDVYERKHKYQLKIKITNTITNEYVIYESYRQAEKLGGYNRSSIQRVVKNNRGNYEKKPIKIELI